MRYNKVIKTRHRFAPVSDALTILPFGRRRGLRDPLQHGEAQDANLNIRRLRESKSAHLWCRPQKHPTRRSRLFTMPTTTTRATRQYYFAGADGEDDGRPVFPQDTAPEPVDTVKS